MQYLLATAVETKTIVSTYYASKKVGNSHDIQTLDTWELRMNMMFLPSFYLRVLWRWSAVECDLGPVSGQFPLVSDLGHHPVPFGTAGGFPPSQPACDVKDLELASDLGTIRSADPHVEPGSVVDDLAHAGPFRSRKFVS